VDRPEPPIGAHRQRDHRPRRRQQDQPNQHRPISKAAPRSYQKNRAPAKADGAKGEPRLSPALTSLR
ncbi:MAG: hypothetical protein ACK4S5_10735, partial [Sphingobium yanoikuyae]